MARRWVIMTYIMLGSLATACGSPGKAQKGLLRGADTDRAVASVSSRAGASGKKLGRKKKAKKSKNCVHGLGGDYSVGRAPEACALKEELADKLFEKHADYVFDDGVNRSSERQRYAHRTYKFLSKTATAYIKRRRPAIKGKSILIWVDFALTVMHQESVWSHYRLGEDDRPRLMRGDYGHGYGLGQIDDRSHKKFIRSGKVFDMEKNFTYSLDMLYSAYTKAVKSPCGNKSDATSVYRSVYGIYNGGVGAKCRWQNSKHKWARNDKNFIDKFSVRKYKKFLDEEVYSNQRAQLIKGTEIDKQVGAR